MTTCPIRKPLTLQQWKDMEKKLSKLPQADLENEVVIEIINNCKRQIVLLEQPKPLQT